MKDLSEDLLFIQHEEEKVEEMIYTWHKPWETRYGRDATPYRSGGGVFAMVGQMCSTWGFTNDPMCHGNRRRIVWRLDMDVNIACAKHREVWRWWRWWWTGVNVLKWGNVLRGFISTNTSPDQEQLRFGSDHKNARVSNWKLPENKFPVQEKQNHHPDH